MVRILVRSFLFKGESFSFVKGLWLLNLNNRKIFLWIFSGSALHLMFFGGDWKISCFLAFRIFCEIYIFFRDHCLVYRRAFSAGAFLQGGLNLLRSSSSCIRGFSLASLWSMITSCYFSVDLAFSFVVQQIWYCWHLLVQERGRIGHLEQNVGLWNHTGLLKLIGIAGIIIIKASTRFSM